MAGEVRVSTLMAYGSISLPIGTIGLPVAIYLAPVYSGQLGIGLGIIGWAMIATRLMDFVTDPIIGVLSDRWRPKIGRRRVWLIIGTLVMMSGVYLLFRPHDTVNIAYFLVALSLVYFGYTTLLLPYKAWGAELSEDYHVRTRLSVRRLLMWAHFRQSRRTICLMGHDRPRCSTTGISHRCVMAI